MSRIRYLLDEDTPHAIRDQLLRHKPEIEVLAVGDDRAPAFGTPDPELLQWIEQEGYVLVSRNRRTMPRHLRAPLDAGGHVPGIFLLRRRYVLGELLEDLILIGEEGRVEEYQDRVEYLPLWFRATSKDPGYKPGGDRACVGSKRTSTDLPIS